MPEAEDLGFDPTRIVVAGHSAGGHLAAMALSTDWPENLPADLVKGQPVRSITRRL